MRILVMYDKRGISSPLPIRAELEKNKCLDSLKQNKNSRCLVMDGGARGLLLRLGRAGLIQTGYEQSRMLSL